MLLRMTFFGSWKLAPSSLSLPATWERWLPAAGLTVLGLSFWSVFHSAGSVDTFWWCLHIREPLSLVGCDMTSR